MEISLGALTEIPSSNWFHVIFQATNLKDLVFTRGFFLSGDLVIGLGVMVKTMDVVWTFLVREYTRVVSAMWLSLVSLLLHFLEEPCLSPNSSSWRVEMQNQTFCSSHAALNLLQNCLDLAFILYIWEAGDTAWRQIDLLFGFLRVWLFSDKLPDEVSKCCISGLPVCSDIQPAWKVLCSNCNLTR